MNPEVFLYLGHYQKQITGDLKYLIKCLLSHDLNAFSLRPDQESREVLPEGIFPPALPL